MAPARADASPRGATTRLGPFTLDEARGALLDARGAEVALRPKSYALLVHLARNAGRLVDRDSIMGAVWPGVFVTDDSITQCVGEIRRALGAEAAGLLRTLPRRGYVLDGVAAAAAPAEATPVAAAPEEPAAAATWTVAARPAGPALPSVAVMPLRALGPEPLEPYFVEGLAHGIADSLAGLRELFVVSTASTLALAEADPLAAGRRLGVRYVVGGMAARAGGRLRLAVQLSDAETGALVWSDRFEADPGDPFSAQDAAATRIAYSLLPHLRRSELQRALRKPPSDLDAHDLVLRALHRMYRFEEDDFAASRSLLLEAVARDPGYPQAHALLAQWHVLRVGEGRSDGVEEDGRLAMRHVGLALEADPAEPLALAVHGHATAFLLGQPEEAVACFDRALASSPNAPTVWALSSPCHAYLGDGRAAVERATYALRLSPLDPYSAFYHGVLGFAHYCNGTHEESVRWARRAASANPRFAAVLRHLAASLVALGRTEEAREAAARLLAVDPRFEVGRYFERYPMRDPSRKAEYARHLRAAGLPG